MGSWSFSDDSPNRLTGGTVSPAVEQNTYFCWAYDSDGRICAAGSASISGGVSAIQYLYDAAGHRVAKGTVNLVGGALSCDTTQNGFTLTNQYILGPGGEQMTELVPNPSSATPPQSLADMTWVHTNVYASGRLLAMLSGSATTFYHQDHLSVRLATDGNGNVVAQEGHFPFGEPWYQSGAGNSWFFTSYYRDSKSGLDYALARDYNSRPGAFNVADPLTGSPGDPQSWNRYAYSRNDPIDIKDPSGKSWGGFFMGLFKTLVTMSIAASGDPVAAFMWGLDEIMMNVAKGGKPVPFGGGSVSLGTSWNGTPWGSAGGLGTGVGIPSGGLQFGACGSGCQQGGGTPTYQGPADVAINGGFLIPVWPVPFVAGVALGVTATYIPKEHLLCAGPQVGLEVGKTFSVGALFSSHGQMSSIAHGLGWNLSAIIPGLFVGGQFSGTFDGKTLPAGGPVAGVPGASGSVSYTGCFHVGG